MSLRDLEKLGKDRDASFEFIKEKWLPALRSGKYEQCRNKLHDGSGFCCLGVAADVMRVRRDSFLVPPSEVEDVSDDDVGNRIYMAMGRVVNHLGDDIGGGYFAEKNDSGHTFEQIAYDIEFKLRVGELR